MEEQKPNKLVEIIGGVCILGLMIFGSLLDSEEYIVYLLCIAVIAITGLLFAGAVKYLDGRDIFKEREDEDGRR